MVSKKRVEMGKVGQEILNNIVGFDLNPLAVLAARTNYLIAFSPFIPYVRLVCQADLNSGFFVRFCSYTNYLCQNWWMEDESSSVYHDKGRLYFSSGYAG